MSLVDMILVILILVIIYMGFTGVYFFLIFAPKHRLWVLVRTASFQYSSPVAYGFQCYGQYPYMPVHKMPQMPQVP